MATMSVWEIVGGASNGQVFRVAEDCVAKVRIDLKPSFVEQFDLWNAGQSAPIPADTTDLRNWLASIPTVV